MHDCFNMAYQDNTNPLQLHIKINSENLLPVPTKYNVGSLRIPADPSWPKIPQRKLIDDVGDTIEPPCIVTVTGTPRRSHTVVRTPLNQSPKSTVTKDSAYSSFHHQKTTSSMHTLKKLPGYADPRFKKVTNVKKSQLTSTESLQRTTNQSDTTSCTEHFHREETEKSMPNRSVNMKQRIIQEAEKPHEEHKIISVQNYKNDIMVNVNQETHLQHPFINDTKLKKVDYISNDNNTNVLTEKCKCTKNINPSQYMSQSTVHDANTQVDITPLAVQENNGQLFFVLDNKIQTHALNTIHVDTITVPQECVKQCYNVQLPVLTYQNIPMQLSSTGAENIMQPCLNHSECIKHSNTSSLIKKESEQHVCPNQTQNITNDTEERRSNNENANEKHNVLTIQSNVPKESKKDCFKLELQEKKCVPEELQSRNTQQHWQESSDSEYYIPSINKKNIYNSNLQRLKIKKIPCHTSGEETTDSEFIMRRNIKKNEFSDTVHGDQINALPKEKENRQSMQHSKVTNQDQTLYSNRKIVVCQNKVRNKSEQNLACTKSECTTKLCRNSEPHITFKQKKVSAKFSRKARSYFQKNSHSALIDSDYTLIWPNCQYTKHKRNQTNTYNFSKPKTKNVKQHINPTTINEQIANVEVNNNSNFDQRNCLQSIEHLTSAQKVTTSLSKIYLQREHCKCEVSPRSNMNEPFKQPKAIPPKTQELLNKSYWEYYNKLKHKIKNTSSLEQQYPYHLAIDTLERGKKGKSSEVYNKELRNQAKVNPELQTLQQCTALSTVINKALDSNLQSDIVQTKELYLNDNIKSPTNGILGVQNANTKMISNLTRDEFVLKNVKCSADKTNEKQFMELKSIIFFGGMMYILIIFLPLLYDYFYYEEYDDYENLSYMEMIVDYVVSSFKEAFGGVFDGVKQIFFYLHTCKKCNNIA